MNKSLTRLLIVLLMAAVAGGGWLAWQSWRARQALKRLDEVVKSTDLDELLRNPPDGLKEAIDLAVRGVRLSQGEAGHESWTLDADWATLRQETGLVQVNSPIVRYALGDPDKSPPRQVEVRAESGRLEDNNTLLTMEGSVRAEYQDEVLTGPVATFRNDARILLFPDGASLDGPMLAGTAGILRWNLATNILDGEKGVDVVWTPQSGKARPSEAAPDGEGKAVPGGASPSKPSPAGSAPANTSMETTR